jgi:large subunit ribosomal protein L17e
LGFISKEPDNATKAAKARGNHLRIHYKHTREIGNAIKGMKLAKAQAYLKDVLEFKQAIPFTKYTAGIGRHAIGKQYKAPGDKVGWPIKATKTYLDLLLNVESNCKVSVLSLILLFIIEFLIDTNDIVRF